MTSSWKSRTWVSVGRNSVWELQGSVGAVPSEPQKGEAWSFSQAFRADSVWKSGMSKGWPLASTERCGERDQTFRDEL